MKTFLLSVSISILCSISFFEFPSFSFLEEEKNDSFAIVQLFTSQGCSSCPSADSLLDKVKKDYKNENVFVLSYHVDYWDRLGWKDPFSKNDFTLLQNAYGFVFNSNRIYTPQAIINGKVQFVGSNEDKMKANLSNFLNKPSKNIIEITNVNVVNNKVTFDYNVDGTISDKELKVALVLESRETPVIKGENEGRKLKNSNVVLKEFNILLSQKTGKGSIEIPALVTNNETLQLIGFIQKSDYEITGAIKSNKFKLH